MEWKKKQETKGYHSLKILKQQKTNFLYVHITKQLKLYFNFVLDKYFFNYFFFILSDCSEHTNTLFKTTLVLPST